MGKVWLFILAVFFHTIFSKEDKNLTIRPDIVNIGAILDFNSSIGKVAKVAIEAAVKDVNSDPDIFLNGTKLRVTMQDTKLSNGFHGIIDSLRFMENETMAIIGPQSSVMAHVVSLIANELQVPLLSFSATDPALSSLQFPYFVRTTQSDLFQMAAVADIVHHYEWRDVIVIFMDDDYGRNGIATLGDKLADKRCKISQKASLSPNMNHDDITNLLFEVALMESRIIILHLYPSSGLLVLETACELNMMESGYVWIATDWLTSTLDTSPSLLASATAYMQGVLTLRMYTPDSALKRNFTSRWSHLISNSASNGSFELNTYGSYAYDTVWVLAHAIDTYFRNGGNLSFSSDSILNTLQGDNLHLSIIKIFNGGSILLQNILEVNMTGLTGRVKFSSDRQLINPAYEVINVIGSGTRRIGYWSNSSGLSIEPPDKLSANIGNHSISTELYSVIWPGQTSGKPRGWVYSSNGRYMRIGVLIRTSYPEFASRSKGSDALSGYCVDVFTAAGAELPYELQYKLIPFDDRQINTSQLLHMIATGDLDALVGDIAITTNRMKMVDFTQPYIESGLVVVAPIRELNCSPWAFLRPFTPMMWCVTALFFLAVGTVVWILERRVNDDFRGPPRRQFFTIIWFSFSTLVFAHREKVVTILGRLVLIFWLFLILILNSSYTASLTSILTVERLTSPVKGIESLVTSNAPIGHQRGSFAENYLIYELNIPKSRLVPLTTPAEYEKALRDGPGKGGVAAVVDDRASVELFLSTRCDFGIVGQEFTKTGWGFAFPRDSPLVIDMSTAILKLSEIGALHRIHEKWLSTNACISEGAKKETDRLQLKSFWGLFLLIGMACFIALLCYFIKMLFRFTRHSSSTVSSSHSARLRSFLSFVNEKEDQCKHKSKRRRKQRGFVHEGQSTNTVSTVSAYSGSHVDTQA